MTEREIEIILMETTLKEMLKDDSICPDTVPFKKLAEAIYLASYKEGNDHENKTT